MEGQPLSKFLIGTPEEILDIRNLLEIFLLAFAIGQASEEDFATLEKM
jgi:DNA-binding FadR family transcriptional regulator